MNAPQNHPLPSILGGPLHRFASWLGLVSRSGSTVAVGLTLGGGLWLVLVLLAYAEGVSDRLWSLTVIGGHVRLLLVIPLLFLAETLLEPRIRDWTAMLLRYRIVPESEHAAFDRLVALINRLHDSWLAELIALGFAIALSVPGLFDVQFGATAIYDSANPEMALTGIWYWFVVLNVFRFLILRWLWRLGLWWMLLWRISRMPLQLIPTHPDRAGGLGFLEVVQSQQLPLVVAIFALHSAAIAEDIATGVGTPHSLYPTLLISLAAAVVLMVGPMLLFLPTMWAHRIEALRQYMGLAAVFVDRMHENWVTPPKIDTDELVNSQQWSSLTDMGSSVSVIREMRVLPVGTRIWTEILIAGIVPALPLLLLEYPVSELAAKVFERILGL